MLVSDDIGPGDLFRSGQLFALPPSPGTLNLTVAPIPPIEPGRLSDELQQQLRKTYPISADIQNLIGFIMAGSIFPQSITIADASLTVGNPFRVTASGSIDVKFFNLWDQSSGFSLSGSIFVGPSRDPLDTSRVVKVTASFSSTDLILDTLFLLPPAAPLICEVLSSAIASKIENSLNERIAALASDALARFQPPLQLTSTAVLSLGRFIINDAGLNLTAVVGDLFGPGIEPIPIPKYISIEVTPHWNCGVAENYTITVLDFGNRTPISGALVSLTSGDGTGEPKSKERHGTTNASGSIGFQNVVLKDWKVKIPQKRGAPDWVENQPLLQVSARGYDTFKTAVDCPPLTPDG
jgi:hypothetical protein